jgi:hypothetical protein
MLLVFIDGDFDAARRNVGSGTRSLLLWLIIIKVVLARVEDLLSPHLISIWHIPIR